MRAARTPCWLRNAKRSTSQYLQNNSNARTTAPQTVMTFQYPRAAADATGCMQLPQTFHYLPRCPKRINVYRVPAAYRSDHVSRNVSRFFILAPVRDCQARFWEAVPRWNPRHRAAGTILRKIIVAVPRGCLNLRENHMGWVRGDMNPGGEFQQGSVLRKNAIFGNPSPAGTP